MAFRCFRICPIAMAASSIWLFSTKTVTARRRSERPGLQSAIGRSKNRNRVFAGDAPAGRTSSHCAGIWIGFRSSTKTISSTNGERLPFCVGWSARGQSAESQRFLSNLTWPHVSAFEASSFAFRDVGLPGTMITSTFRSARGRLWIGQQSPSSESFCSCHQRICRPLVRLRHKSRSFHKAVLPACCR